MNSRKLKLYNKANTLYKVKLADAGTPYYYGNMSQGQQINMSQPTQIGGTMTPTGQGMLPNTAMNNPWYKVRMWENGAPNIFAMTGAVTTAIPGVAMGYNLGHGLARRWGLDENSWGSRLLRYGGGTLGGLAGWKIGKYAMLPFQAGNAASQALGGGFMGGAANIGLMIGGGMAYDKVTRGTMNHFGQTGTNWVNNSASSHNDAASAADAYMNKRYYA